MAEQKGWYLSISLNTGIHLEPHDISYLAAIFSEARIGNKYLKVKQEEARLAAAPERQRRGLYRSAQQL